MKKNYNSPLVEAVSVMAKYNMLQAVSPTSTDLPTSYEPGFQIPGN